MIIIKKNRILLDLLGPWKASQGPRGFTYITPYNAIPVPTTDPSAPTLRTVNAKILKKD